MTWQQNEVLNIFLEDLSVKQIKLIKFNDDFFVHEYNFCW